MSFFLLKYWFEQRFQEISHDDKNFTPTSLALFSLFYLVLMTLAGGISVPGKQGQKLLYNKLYQLLLLLVVVSE